MKNSNVEEGLRVNRRRFTLAALAGSAAFASSLMGETSSAHASPKPVSSVLDWNLDSKTIIDLSHVQEHEMPVDPALTLPTMSFFAHIGQGEGAYWNLENITYTPHTGTHMDAPFHVNSGWGSIETLNPALLFGPATVLSITVPKGMYAISLADIKAWEEKNGQIPLGDAVLVHTGHDRYWPDKKTYIDDGYPIFSKDAAEYIASRKARYVGMETISPDGPNTDAHQIFMGNNVLVVENLANIGEIGKKRCLTIGTFPNIKGATGVYVRLLAVVDK
ncbi:cyclase [Betaproteobacteria bacterium]|nr:cyclase [Betaproteobacteria bacterium]